MVWPCCVPSTTECTYHRPARGGHVVCPQLLNDHRPTPNNGGVIYKENCDIFFTLVIHYNPNRLKTFVIQMIVILFILRVFNNINFADTIITLKEFDQKETL